VKKGLAKLLRAENKPGRPRDKGLGKK